MTDLAAIHPAAARTSVQARLPDGRIFEAPIGASLRAVLAIAAQWGDDPAVAAIVNGRLTELTVPLAGDADVAPITARDSDGVRIYRRSLVFLLVTAAAEVFPEAAVVIDHAATTVGAYFCSVVGRPPFSQAELDRIAARMREIVGQDAPIVKTGRTNDEAMAVFEARGERDKARLLAHRTKPGISLYELRGRLDYFQGYMVPSAGLLTHFALHAHPPGFMLQFPHQSRPTVLDAVTPYPKLFAVFEEYAN